MYKKTNNYLLDGTRVCQLINGNWVTVAQFSHHSGATYLPETMALMFFNLLEA